MIFLPEKRLLHQLAENMDNGYVTFLDARRVLPRNRQIYIHQIPDTSTILTKKSHGPATHFASKAKGGKHVRRRAAGGYTDHHITFPGKGFHLTAKYCVKTIVVTHRGYNRCVRAQGNGRQASPLELKTADDLSGQVLGIGSRAPIPHDKEFIAVPKDIHEQIRDKDHLRAKFPFKSPHYLTM
jgi:hypothetical protein